MNALADPAIQTVDMPGEPVGTHEVVKMNEATVEERLVRVETKTDRLIKDVDEGRAETRAQYEKLRDVIAANDKAVRTDMQEMEARLVLRQDEATTAVRSELKATEANLGTKFTAAVTEIRTEFTAAVTEIRTEFTATVTEIRTEFTAAVTEIRTEVTAAVTEIRTEVKSAVTEIRTEVKSAEVGLRKDLDAQRDSMRIDANRTFEAVAKTRGYVKALVLVVAPLALAVTGYVLKVIFGGG